MAINVEQIIADSLIELSNSKPLAKITISDIVNRSGIARQTFYNHFLDKNDLIYWIFKSTLRGERHLVEECGCFAYLCSLYTEAQKKASFLKQACDLQGQNALSAAIYQQTYDYYKNLILKKWGPEVVNEELEYALVFNSYGAGSLYVKWAKEGMTGDPVTRARYAIHCMPEIMKKYILIKPEDKNC